MESGWNVWVWLVVVVVRRYIDFIILLIPTPLVSVLFCSSIPTFCSSFEMFFVLYNSPPTESDSSLGVPKCRTMYIYIYIYI